MSSSFMERTVGLGENTSRFLGHITAAILCLGWAYLSAVYVGGIYAFVFGALFSVPEASLTPLASSLFLIVGFLGLILAEVIVAEFFVYFPHGKFWYLLLGLGSILCFGSFLGIVLIANSLFLGWQVAVVLCVAVSLFASKDLKT